MKKFFITSLMALIACFSMQAQVTELRMATLIQGSKTSVYYGENAFVKAYEAADDTLGVIILSSGDFKSPYRIYKSISVYGAGMQGNKESKTSITSVESIKIQSYKDYDENGKEYYKFPNGCHFEGLYIPYFYVDYNNSQYAPMYDLNIKKCCVSNTLYLSTNCHNTLLTQSKIGTVEVSGLYQYNLRISNCHLGLLSTSNDNLKSTINVDHCIVSSTYTTGIAYYTNNIIYGTIAANSTAYKNIFGTSGSMASPVTADNNWMNIANNGIFEAENEDGSYGIGKTYALKYPKKYIGTDGTEVGLNGGTYKWNPTPCLPRITSSEIDTRTTTDGKLKVSIKVEAQTAD